MINFPFQNQQQLNLDWIMSKLKTILDFLPVDNGGVGDILQRGEKGAEWQRPSAASMDIIGLATKASPANNDYIPIYDRTASANKKVTITSILSKVVFPVSSVNSKTGAVTLSASDVGALPSSYTPTVRSVNNKTGAVSLSASDVGALPASYTPPVTSVNGQTGEVNIATVNPLTVMPIGYVYISTSDTSPQTLFGGTWTKLGGGKVLLSSGGSYVAGETGGTAQHVHTTQGHVLTQAEIPNFTGSVSPVMFNEGYTPSVSGIVSSVDAVSNRTWNGEEGPGTKRINFSFGGGQSHSHGDTGAASNIPPYLCVKMWERTA